MNTNVMISSLFEQLSMHLLGFLGLFILFVLIPLLSSARFKGWQGEASVNRGLRLLDPSQYQVFHDLYLPRPDGRGTTQIDHLVISPFGVFVIETKNYKGWIFGSEKQRQWTQQIYRKKSRFQNPLHQNDLHVRALMECLGLPRECFLPVVFFVGNAQFKTPMPPNVLNKGLLPWILQHQQPRMGTSAMETALGVLREVEDTIDRKVAARAHASAIRERVSSKPQQRTRKSTSSVRSRSKE